MKPKSLLIVILFAALAPLAWAGPQAAQSNMAASSQSNGRARGQANLTGHRGSAAIQSGTRISGRLLTSLNAEKAKPGQRVEARVIQNVKQNGHVVIRKNSRLLGHVVSAQAAGKGNSHSQVEVVFNRLIQGNASTALNTVVTSIVSMPMAPMPEPMSPAPMSPAEGSGSGGGGLVGGVGGAVGSTVGGALGAAGSAADTVGATAGSTVNAAGQMGTEAAGSAANAISVTNSIGALGVNNAAGAVGAASAGASNRMGNAALNSSGQASNQTAATSTFNRRNGNVDLSSGTELQFQVAGSAHTQTPAQQ